MEGLARAARDHQSCYASYILTSRARALIKNERHNTIHMAALFYRVASRKPAVLGSAVRLASTEAKAPLVTKALSDDGILTLRFNLEKKVRPAQLYTVNIHAPHIVWHELTAALPLFARARSSTRGPCP